MKISYRSDSHSTSHPSDKNDCADGNQHLSCHKNEPDDDYSWVPLFEYSCEIVVKKSPPEKDEGKH